ncbi:MAG: hypothetical protein ACE5GW_03915 [Planctomycetota bacterium]
MAVDYREQYTPDQLEPFWPNEILRMAVVVLCTLALIMAFVVLPVILDFFGVASLLEEEEPANPRETPAHIRPEWYFLAVYQYLKLPPQEMFGISGKTIGVLSQGPFFLALLLLPFWARRWSRKPPGGLHSWVVFATIAIFLGLTYWAIWPPGLIFIVCSMSALLFFYFMIRHERDAIRRLLNPEKEPSR